MRLIVLWDPLNPLTPVSEILDSLRELAEVVEVTFDQLGHRTLPNGRCSIRFLVEGLKPDALLWIEGGPLPNDLDSISCMKACWLLNAHLEPTLATDLAPHFDLHLSAWRALAEGEAWNWLPLAAPLTSRAPTMGIYFAGADPTPGAQIPLALACAQAVAQSREIPIPLVVCPAQNGHLRRRAPSWSPIRWPTCATSGTPASICWSIHRRIVLRHFSPA